MSKDQVSVFKFAKSHYAEALTSTTYKMQIFFQGKFAYANADSWKQFVYLDAEFHINMHNSAMVCIIEHKLA